MRSRLHFHVSATLLLLAPVATAADALAWGGFVEPSFSTVWRPDARERDAFTYGFEQSRVGLHSTGSVAAAWSYSLELLLDAQAINTITSSELVDRNGDGNSDSVHAERRTFRIPLVNKATVRFAPLSWLSIDAGSQRIPFVWSDLEGELGLALGSRSSTFERLQSGPDLGVLVGFQQAPVRVSIGAFNGYSLALGPAGSTVRGMAFLTRLDISPWGTRPLERLDPTSAATWVEVAVACVYRPAEIFDPSGEASSLGHEVRTSAGVRGGAVGIAFQLEGALRRTVDSTRHRSTESLAANIELSYYRTWMPGFGLAPALRAGLLTDTEGSQPLSTVWGEAGLLYYPLADANTLGRVSLGAFYRHERELFPAERAHLALARLLLEF